MQAGVITALLGIRVGGDPSREVDTERAAIKQTCLNLL